MDDEQINLVRPFGDGSVVVAGPGWLRIVDPASGDVRAEVRLTLPIALAANGETYAVGTDAGDVLVGSRSGGGPRAVDSGTSDIVGLALLPDGTVAVARANEVDGSISVITPSGERRERALPTVPRAVATSGRWLFVGGMDGSLRVIDPGNLANELVTTGIHSTDLSSIDVAPAGSLIATGSDDRTIVLWDIGNDGGARVRSRLLGHTDRVTSLSFAPEGGWLASSGEDHFVALWDVASGRQIGDAIAVPGNPAVAFASEGERTLLVAEEGLDSWAMSPAGWTRAACAIIGGRALTDEERQRFLRGERSMAACPPG
jgi:WD40 repeat protein